MKKYRQLSREQRYQIEALLGAGKRQVEIASIIGVDRSTVSREIKRNTGSRGRFAKQYLARLAHSRAESRHKVKPKCIKFTAQLKQQAKGWLEGERLSPELIAVEWKATGVKGVSHERPYQWIWDCKKGNKKEDAAFKGLYRYLRHGRRKRKRGNAGDNTGQAAEQGCRGGREGHRQKDKEDREQLGQDPDL